MFFVFALKWNNDDETESSSSQPHYEIRFTVWTLSSIYIWWEIMFCYEIRFDADAGGVHITIFSIHFDAHVLWLFRCNFGGEKTK